METGHTFFFFVIIIIIPFYSANGLILKNNGYEDLRVVIQERVPENDALLGRIEDILKNASALLYKATHKRAYFKTIKVIVPKTWTKKDSYTIISTFTSSSSHIRIGNSKEISPLVVGNEDCGKEGLYLYLHYKEFVLQEGLTPWGKHDSVVVHEWGHLRYGLKDEYPTLKKAGVENTVNSVDTVNFYQENGMWKPVGCPRDIRGYASATCRTGKSESLCNTDNIDHMIGDACRFCPDMIQTVNASLMWYQFIPSIVEFCDTDNVNTPVYMRHNSHSDNEQNKYCNGKSSWEIVRQHEDFKND